VVAHRAALSGETLNPFLVDGGAKLFSFSTEWKGVPMRTKGVTVTAVVAGLKVAQMTIINSVFGHARYFDRT
jgi:hypothetical protein